MNPEIKKSLEISWKEGIPAQITISLVEYYLIPFALFLKATTQEIGFLVAIPHLLGSVSQLFAVAVVRHAGSRLKFLTRGIFLQASVLIPLASLAIFDFSSRIKILIILTVIFRAAANLIGTAWGSLVSDYLSPQMRGKYIGWRTQVAGIAGVMGVIAGGILLSLMKNVASWAGFFVLFLFAAVCRFLSCYLMSKMKDLPLQHKPESDFTFLMFIRRFKESNFVKYVLFVSSIIFATNLAAPYFSVYMLKNLNFTYLNYMSIQTASIISSLIAFPIWGRHADIVGNAKILKITSFLIPAIPFLWLISRNIVYLWFVEFTAGFIWAGFNLCAANFIFDAVTPEKRVRCIGYVGLINGVAIFLGSTIGGFLAGYLPPLLGFPLLTLFVLSGSLRFFAQFFLSRHFREVRESTRYVSSLRLFFSVIGINPLVMESSE